MVLPACQKVSTFSRRSNASCSITGARSSKRAARTNGITPKRSPSDRCCWKEFRSGCRVRTVRAEPSARGTRSFTMRRPAEPYVPLMHLAEKQARICIYNSLLSEAAVLGFDYGYSLDYPEHALLVGSAVRRFRQWRANDHRSVHRLGGIEMAAAERHCAAAPARLRRPGPGTFQRAARALSASMRRGQHSGLQSHHRRAVFSCAAPPDETRFHQTAHHHDAKESVARRSSRRRRAKNFIHGRFEEILGSPEAGPADKDEARSSFARAKFITIC